MPTPPPWRTVTTQVLGLLSPEREKMRRRIRFVVSWVRCRKFKVAVVILLAWIGINLELDNPSFDAIERSLGNISYMLGDIKTNTRR